MASVTDCALSPYCFLYVWCRCRKGGAEILVSFDDLYPSKIVTTNEEKGLSEKAKTALQGIQICGEEVPRGYWVGVFFSAVFLDYHVSNHFPHQG